MSLVRVLSLYVDIIIKWNPKAESYRLRSRSEIQKGEKDFFSLSKGVTNVAIIILMICKLRL